MNGEPMRPDGREAMMNEDRSRGTRGGEPGKGKAELDGKRRKEKMKEAGG